MSTGKMKALVTACAASVGMTITVAVFTAIPVSMIVMGSLYKDDCPAEDMIAIYLIVMGVVTTVRNVISLSMKHGRTTTDDDSNINPLTCLIDVFLSAWFIAGCVFVYRTKDNFQSHDSDADDFCNYTFYWYSFWITTSSFIIMGVAMVLACCFVCCFWCCS